MKTRRFTILSTKQEIGLNTEFVYPPIPCRSMDWQAIDDDTYDASYEGEDESGSVWKCSPSGSGETEVEAINNLIDQLEDSFEQVWTPETARMRVGGTYGS